MIKTKAGKAPCIDCGKMIHYRALRCKGCFMAAWRGHKIRTDLVAGGEGQEERERRVPLYAKRVAAGLPLFPLGCEELDT